MSAVTQSNTSLSFATRQSIERALVRAISAIGLIPLETVVLEQPAETDRGDLASAVALQLTRSLTPDQRAQFPTPLSLAGAIVEALQSDQTRELQPLISRVEAVAPGFINFHYSQELLLQEMLLLAAKSETAKSAIGGSEAVSTKHVVIEYVSPNTNKPLHIGHLRNAALGWSLSQLLAESGAQVQKAIVFNDRGLHIMKSCWGYLIAGRQDAAWRDRLCAGELADSLLAEIDTPIKDWQSTNQAWQGAPDQWLTPNQMTNQRLQKADHFIGFWYQLAEYFAQNEAVTTQWSQMLLSWEDETQPLHQPLRALWSTMNAWFYQGFEQTRQRFGFGFDEVATSYESQIYQKGKDLVVAAADQGILERLPDGAITARLEKDKLPDKILLRRDGTGIYMTFDIELTRQRTAGDAQQLIWIVGVDQQLYFQQLFAVAQQLGYGEKERYHHLGYGMVRLPEGKMSSRKGLVLYGDDILEQAVNQAKTIMTETGSRDHMDETEFDRVAEAVGIGAVKWTMLSVDPLSELTFDVATSVSFTGFAGPYVQYTYARCRSVLQHAISSIAIDFDTIRNILIQKKSLQINDSEMALLRNLFTYYEIVRYGTEKLAPHLLCNYLYQLCQRFNTFYAVCPIVSDASLATDTKQLRLALTLSTANVLSQGLGLLGLTVVERM